MPEMSIAEIIETLRQGGEGQPVTVWVPRNQKTFNTELNDYFENLWENIGLEVTDLQKWHIMETFREWLLDWKTDCELNIWRKGHGLC